MADTDDELRRMQRQLIEHQARELGLRASLEAVAELLAPHVATCYLGRAVPPMPCPACDAFRAATGRPRDQDS